MAIDHIPHPESHNLIHKDKGFYPVKIPVAHWQLRHYISTPEPNLLYFASRREIFCLDTSTNKRRHIATLPFEARCTASGYGYVCVGGEDCGHFAVVKLDGAPVEGVRSGEAGQMDVDTALPFDAWRGGSRSQSSGVEGGRRAVSVKVERIGEEIVNSISIHRLHSPDDHLDDIVAVLTNNDRTVRIYSLPRGVETTVLDLPFPMNHATISPDGQTLVAVGDVNLAYFFQREVAGEVPLIPKPHNRLSSAACRWHLTSVVSLHVSEQAGTICCFTTAWSPSGALVAVGSEGGYITVFDVEMLADVEMDAEDAIVAVVPGSRPDVSNPHPGAIRSMMFSPEPWDLLIWAEDQGRICIGDLRTGLRSRQVVPLEPKDESLRRITFEDVPGENLRMGAGMTSPLSAADTSLPRDIDELEADFIRRYRNGEDTTSVNFATEYIEARRRQRAQRAEMAMMRSQLQAIEANSRDRARESGERREAGDDDDPRGLTAEEQQIFDSLRNARQREEARSGESGRARGVNYTSADMFREYAAASRGQRDGTGDASRPISDVLSSVQDASFPELARTSASPGPRPTSSHGPGTPSSLPSLESLSNSGGRGSSGSSQWASATTNSLVRLSDGSRLPRRRASVVLTPPTTNSSQTPTSSGGTTTRASAAAAAAAAAAEEEQEENPWRTIEEHMSLARGPLFDSTSRRNQVDPDSLFSSGAASNRASTSTTTQPTSSSPQGLTRAANEFARQRDRERERDLEARAVDVEAERVQRVLALAMQRERARSRGEAAGSTLGPNPPSTTNTSSFSQSNDILLRRAQAQAAERLSAARGFTGYASAIGAGAWAERAPGEDAATFRGMGFTGMPGMRSSRLGVMTAGLAMSEDGERIWAACEEGIFEVRVNRKRRMFWGSVEVR